MKSLFQLPLDTLLERDHEHHKKEVERLQQVFEQQQQEKSHDDDHFNFKNSLASYWYLRDCMYEQSLMTIQLLRRIFSFIHIQYIHGAEDDEKDDGVNSVHVESHYLNFALVSKLFCVALKIEIVLKSSPQRSVSQEATELDVKNLWRGAIEKSILIQSQSEERNEDIMKLLALILIEENNVYMTCVKSEWLKGLAFCRAAIQGQKKTCAGSFSVSSLVQPHCSVIRAPFCYDPLVYCHDNTKEFFLVVTRHYPSIVSVNTGFKELLFDFVVKTKNIRILRNIRLLFCWNYFIEKWNYKLPCQVDDEMVIEIMRATTHAKKVWTNLPEKFKRNERVLFHTLTRRGHYHYNYSDLNVECYFTAPLEAQLRSSLLENLLTHTNINRFFFKHQHQLVFVKQALDYFRKNRHSNDDHTDTAIKMTFFSYFLKFWQGPKKFELAKEFIRGIRKELFSREILLQTIIPIFTQQPEISKRSLNKFAFHCMPQHLLHDETVLRALMEQIPHFGCLLTKNFWSKHHSVLEELVHILNVSGDHADITLYFRYSLILVQSMNYRQRSHK
ncbi:hypothetical protein C9374_003888 [Naegleria lovaniensis]|uniref:Uncharacterized protein n=1 Tax=Naegleria lovaniensis TaxID=51637 RepID=A0AA88H0T2_NAELO|nr:uncharacterized protein C9374_003888 [Naegleria lovaniensis]KAG2394124.1 hypothetical protein C9374_003888 [Naegleria lovaniensis]